MPVRFCDTVWECKMGVGECEKKALSISISVEVNPITSENIIQKYYQTDCDPVDLQTAAAKFCAPRSV